MRTEESWHSVEELGPDEGVRNSIALTFYIKGQEYRSAPPARDASASDRPQPDEDMSAALRTLAATFTRGDDISTLFCEGAVGVELGVATGALSERILHYPHIGHLFGIDSWTGAAGQGLDHYREAIARLSAHRDRTTLMRLHFAEALDLFGDQSLDFIYVNGYAHDGELSAQLLRTWYPKLRPGGIIAGDEYSRCWPLVVAAVDDFATANGLERHVIDCREDGGHQASTAWFAMKP